MVVCTCELNELPLEFWNNDNFFLPSLLLNPCKVVLPQFSHMPEHLPVSVQRLMLVTIILRTPEVGSGVSASMLSVLLPNENGFLRLAFQQVLSFIRFARYKCYTSNIYNVCGN